MRATTAARIFLSMVLLYGVYLETGPFTTIAIGLGMLYAELTVAHSSLLKELVDVVKGLRQ